MALETASYVAQLNATNPPDGDPVAQAGDHLRLIKAALVATFPKLNGPVNLSANQLNNQIPVGAITAFYGSAAPSGWAFCDGGTYARSDGTGNIVTPNLKGRFVIGADPTDTTRNITPGSVNSTALGTQTATTSAVGDHTHSAVCANGGSHNHGGTTDPYQLQVADLPPHSHGVPHNLAETITAFKYGTDLTAAQFVGGTQGTFQSYNIGDGNPHAHTIETGGSHQHAISLSNAGGHAHTLTFNPTPPYMALYMIMKI